MKFFGRRAACPDNDVPLVPVPVGETCAHCHETIVAGDDGWWVPYLGSPGEPRELAFHHACHLRGIIGSVAHQKRLCSCYVPGSTCGDDPKLTRRKAAEAARDEFIGR